MGGHSPGFQKPLGQTEHSCIQVQRVGTVKPAIAKPTDNAGPCIKEYNPLNDTQVILKKHASYHNEDFYCFTYSWFHAGVFISTRVFLESVFQYLDFPR